MQQFTKTLKKGFDGVFTEVTHTESLGLRNPNELRIFHLDVANNAFSFDALHDFLIKNIGRYVFSRARMEQFEIEGDTESVGLRAIHLLQNAYKMDEKWIDEDLGDVMLYVFLEQILDAPKLFSKIELAAFGDQGVLHCGGVHLLSLGNTGPTPSYQMVFGKSNIIGDLQDAIDNAFESLVEIRDNTSSELKIVESTIFSQSYDPQTTDFLKSIIVPSKNINATVDRAFGVFLGYSIGLNPDNYSNTEFRNEVMRKMDIDIKAHVAYIIEKIKETKLGAHSFYFYILPFNDADGEKRNIMDTLLNGGV